MNYCWFNKKSLNFQVKRNEFNLKIGAFFTQLNLLKKLSEISETQSIIYMSLLYWLMKQRLFLFLGETT